MSSQTKKAFTIIELLIIIVIIGILAIVAVSSYSSVQSRAITASIQSDLLQASNTLELLKTASSTNYPTTLSSAGIKSSNSGSTYSYSYINGGSQYCLSETNGSTVYSIASSDMKVKTGDCLTNGMYAWWKFNGNALDSSGNGNDGTVMNGATLTTGQNGAANGAYNFAAASFQYIDFTSAQTMPTEAGSASFWVKLTDNALVQNILFWGNELEDGCTGLVAISLATCNFVIQGDIPPNAITSYPPPNLLTGAWFHIVFLWDYNLGYIKIYSNGIFHGSSALNFKPSFPKGIQRIGRPGAGSRFMNGTVDDMRIYYRALTDSEISSLYSQGAQ